MLTKDALIKMIATETGETKVTVGNVLAALAVTLELALKHGQPVTLPGIGKLTAKARPERQVRNPATGATSMKPADKKISFTAAKALKDAVQA